MKADVLKRALALVMAIGCVAVQGAVIDSSFKIVIPKKRPLGVQNALEQAGRELSAALKEGAGIDVAVVWSDEFKGPMRKSPAIFLGAGAAERAGVMPPDLKGFENMIVEKGGNLYLFGHDVQRFPKEKNPPWKKCVLPTVKAVTRFMEKFLDVRFLGPGEVGKDIPKTETVEVPAGYSDRHLPPIDYAPATGYTLTYGYAANAFGPGAYHSYGGHTYHHACPSAKYFKEHPEYFGLINGRRTPVPVKNSTLCISNPKIEDLIVEELVARLDEGALGVQLGQQDGRQWCQCGSCKAYGGPAADTVGEKLWILHRKVAERVAKLRPGKIVNIISYSETATPPKTFREFPENVMIEVCHPTEKRLKNWTENYVVPHGFVVYIYLWGNYPMPGLTAKRSFMHCANMVRMFKRYGVHGIYRCGFGELFGMEGPAYYPFGRLIDEPQADVNAVVQEYCDRAYGPAFEAMKTFHETLDRRLMATDLMINPDSEFGCALPTSALDLLAYIYTPDVTAKMESCLVRAEGLAATTKQKTRLALVRREFDYARNLGKVAALYASYRFSPSELTFAPLADAIEEREGILNTIYGGNDAPDGLPAKFPGWPEILPFGNNERRVLLSNGRLSARIGSPLRWNVKMMRENKMLPGKDRLSLNVVRTDAVPSFGDFEGGAWAACGWNALNGIMSEKPLVMSRFKALAGRDSLYLAVEGGVGKEPRFCGVGRDGPCGGEECFVLTVSPQDSTDAYYRFMWNTDPKSRWDGRQGHIKDPLDPKFGKVDDNWNGDWKVESEFKDGLWRSMIAIPYATLGVSAPGKGAAWGFNVGRIADCAAKNSFRVYLLWNPNFESPTGVLDPAANGLLKFR